MSTLVGIILCLLLPIFAFAQPISDNYIWIEFVNESYDCGTGKITFQYRIHNQRHDGLQGRYSSAVHIDAGASFEYTHASLNSYLHTFTGTYNPGDVITIGAEGQIDNDAPYERYQFIANSVSVPNVPTISSSNGLLLCNGASTTLTASGTTGTVYWNTGAVGNSITVTSAGNYYAYASSGCGTSANSNSINISLGTFPSAPSVASSNGNLPCNSVSTVLTATPSGGNSISIAAPTSLSGSYTYSLVNVQESSSTACVNSASGSATVSVNALPSAIVSGNASVCQNGSSPVITFTGSGGTAPYIFTYRVNGGALQTVTSTGNTASLSAPTNLVGSFVYSLVSVQESSSTNCTSAASGTATVTVTALPTANLTGTATVCQNGTTPSLTFSASGGVAPYAFSYRINGGALQTINTVSGNSVALSVPTSTAGSFVYTLVSVQDNSANSCTNLVSGSATITVNPLAVANVSGSTTVCRNAVNPTISFNASGGTAPYTFGYRINGGGLLTVTSVGNTATVSVPTNTSGTFVYTLVSVQESSGTACVNAASGSATVVVNPLPLGAVSGTTAVCQNGVSPAVLFTGTGGPAPYTFSYQINGGTIQTVTTVAGSSVSVSAPTNLAGVYNSM